VAVVILLNVGYSAARVTPTAFSNGEMRPPQDYKDGGFTPVGASLPQDLPDTPLVLVEPNEAPSEILRWDPYHREISVRIDQPSTVRLKTYTFPGWTASIDGQRVPLLSDRDGIQQVSVEPGRHTIETSFVSTPPRLLGGGLCLLGVAVVVGLAAVDFRKTS